MPPGKVRSKDDTWTTDELNKALKGTREELDNKKHRRDGEGRSRRQEDDDRRERRKPKAEVNGEDERRHRRKEDDGRSRRKDDDDRRRHRREESHRDKTELTEEERERQRRERREKHEMKGGKGHEDKKRPRGEKPRVIEDDDDDPRRHRDRDDDRRRHRDRDDNDRERRHHEDDRGHRSQRRDEDSYRRKHKEETANEERERQRLERREKKEKKEGKHRKETDKYDEKKDRVKGDKRDRDRERGRDKERERENNREQDKELQRERQRHEDKSKDQKSTRGEETGSKQKDGEDDYNYDDEEFEDYEEDFEEDEEEEEEEDLMFKRNVEMDDILKALNEENAHVTSDSKFSNWSDSPEPLEERHKEPSEEMNRGRTFINFVSAKQRVLNSKTASKTRKRGEDLQQMIELDRARFDMFDLPPVREYELYIRSFGRSNTKQSYVQTNEDNIDRDIQTEDINYKEKWTQHPAEDMIGCGGDGIDAESVQKDQAVSSYGNTARLGQFLQRVGQTMGILLEEERDTGSGEDLECTQSNIGFSDGYTQLGNPSFLEGRYVEKACFCPGQPSLLMTLHSQPTEPLSDQTGSLGLACVWNINDLSYPQNILACESHPTCCCFSPSKATLAFSGMTDGSVAVWDLREPVSLHCPVRVKDKEHVLRFPTYNTAGVLENENHHSRVVTIIPMVSSVVSSKGHEETDFTSGLSFQLATCEENALINLWVVAEIASPDMAGSESDLGLAPGGRIKLLKSSSVTLQNPSKDTRLRSNVQAFELELMPNDLNHFYIGTDTGYVIHGIRFGSRVFPRGYSTKIESPVQVLSIDFSPFGHPYLLAGCGDGSLHLYHTKSENPLVSWPSFSQGHSVICVRWSRSRAAVFYVLDSNSTIHVFDLLENHMVPVQRDQITSGRVVTLCLTNDPKFTGSGSRLPQLLLALDNGRTEIHTITKALRESQTLEEEFLEKFIDKF